MIPELCSESPVIALNINTKKSKEMLDSQAAKQSVNPGTETLEDVVVLTVLGKSSVRVKRNQACKLVGDGHRACNVEGGQ